MSFTFRSKRNPVTGHMEWAIEDGSEADFYQDIARSGYADMLRDDERNKLYYQALRNVIKEIRLKLHKHIHVVDIGTGTGLLSMMATTAGADQVTAIEAFDPVAEMARQVIRLNGHSDKITVISKRSTDISRDEMPQKGDIAVAEVFDTELIGENALRSFSDAQKNLLKPGARVIPSKAKVYAQLVCSDYVLDWHCAKSIQIPQFGIDVRVPSSIARCSGMNSAFDIQMNQLPCDQFQTIGDPLVIFEFDFEKPICFTEHKSIQINLPTVDSLPKSFDAVFVWWDLDMDGSGNLILSTKPDWSSTYQDKIWRDHWIQAVYFLPHRFPINPGQSFYLNASHDEYSFYFSCISGEKLNNSHQIFTKNHCTCMLHQILTKNNMARFNDMERYERFCAVAGPKVRGRICVCFGECSLLPLLTSLLGAERVVIIEPDDHCSSVIAQYVSANECLKDNVAFVDSIDNLDPNFRFGAVICDPFSTSSFLPWHNLFYWRKVDELRSKNLLADDVNFIPEYGTLMCIPVEFDHLWKIKAPAEKVEGFDMKPFDDVVQGAIQGIDRLIEPQPLWEYPAKACACPLPLLKLEFQQGKEDKFLESSSNFILASNTLCNGIVFWIDWYCNGRKIDTSGLDWKKEKNEEPLASGAYLKWTRSCRQAVHFLSYPFKPLKRLKVDAKFSYDGCEMTCKIAGDQ